MDVFVPAFTALALILSALWVVCCRWVEVDWSMMAGILALKGTSRFDSFRYRSRAREGHEMVGESSLASLRHERYTSAVEHIAYGYLLFILFGS